MKKMHDDDLPLSLDPEESLRFENQLLELKLKAEFGAHTVLDGDIPAEIENEFLRNVIDFETNYSKSEDVKIREILEYPFMKPEPQLYDWEVERYLDDVNQMLLAKNITVDFGSSYDSRTKYKFITEELFEESVFQAGIPGMMMHFIYEEFHPDHKVDLEIKAKKFISAWFDQDVEKIVWELGDMVILPRGSSIKKEKMQQKLQNVFNRYYNFSENTYAISDINFEVNDDVGMGYAEGVVSYTGIMTQQEAIAIQGRFKLYFCLEYGWWDIFYFDFPGFDFLDDGG